MNHSHLLQQFKDIMNNASNEELSELLMVPAKNGIEQMDQDEWDM